MQIKCNHKKFGNNKCIIVPKYYFVGLCFKVIDGDHAGSIFCCDEKEFTFSLFAKFQLLLIKLKYWFYYSVYRYWFIVIPYKLKNRLNKNNDDLPF